MSFLRLLCCYSGDSSEPTKVAPLPQSLNKKRVISQIPIHKVRVIDDQTRRASSTPIAYSCPICFQYFSNVLFCGDCGNCLCAPCLNQIVEKADLLEEQLLCCFCKSSTSVYKDWQTKEGRTYFDRSDGAFVKIIKSPLKFQKQSQQRINSYPDAEDICVRDVTQDNNQLCLEITGCPNQNAPPN